MATDMNRGFLIARKNTGQLVDAYLDQISRTNLNYFHQLPKLILPNNLRCYRGFSREPSGPMNIFQEFREIEAQRYIINLIDQCEIDDLEDKRLLPHIENTRDNLY
jgi:hypothetical protein